MTVTLTHMSLNGHNASYHDMITTDVLMQTSYATGDQNNQLTRRFIYLLTDIAVLLPGMWFLPSYQGRQKLKL